MSQSTRQDSATASIPPHANAYGGAYDDIAVTSGASRDVTVTVAIIVAAASAIALLVLFVTQPMALHRWGQATTLAAGIGLLLILAIATYLLWQSARASQTDLRQALQRVETLAQVDHEGAQIIAELERRSAEQTERENLAAALAVPLIRVTDHVLVAPLVGTVDQKRLYHIRSSLMQGLEDQRARVVLIDLTGVARIQNEATDLLAQLLSAIELMGCKVLLTGISRSLAQTLLSQDTPLDVETRRDVMSGLARATELMGQTNTLVH